MVKPTKSVIYNIYVDSEDYSQMQILDEFECLFDLIQAEVQNQFTTCHVRLDIGPYIFIDSEELEKCDDPIFHIVIAAPDTEHIESLVENRIKRCSYIYYHFDKYENDENVLTEYNSDMLDSLSMRQSIVKLHVKHLKKFFSVAHKKTYGI